MLINILGFIFVFTIIALSHELGHFFAAKKAGIRVYELALGFGPRLFGIKRKGTLYAINLIPILGYVKIAGMEDEEEKECPEEEKYYNKSVAAKFAVGFFGPFFNFIAAFLIFSFVFSFLGVPYKISNEIAAIVKNSPAEKVGLKERDVVLSIDGKKIEDMEKAIEIIHKSADKRLTLTIKRDVKTFNVTVAPKYDEKMKVALIGFQPKTLYRKVNPLQAVYHGMEQTVSMTAFILVILGKLLTGAISVKGLAGPLGIAQITSRYAHSGILSLLTFTAFLSINIGVLNLLPLPALDGGRLIFVIIEAIRRKPIKIEIENRIHRWGLIFLLGLIFIVTINDFLRILGR
jgi:regulator of sigma E protease